MKAFEFDLKMKDRTIKTFVYSETGLDIEERFPNMTVSNIKETDDPIKPVSYTHLTLPTSDLV